MVAECARGLEDLKIKANAVETKTQGGLAHDECFVGDARLSQEEMSSSRNRQTRPGS
ncbi:hypothetical protein IF1G_06122 [Cordyceps javanica]|uniref:Uncharacterized protein n=1 Tax=Cordyceps javanica TaxID=43265 RepID=A0A545V086_9HYPO|nr:hypothetical protein IF1G_06122 [Cordyceps javanica]